MHMPRAQRPQVLDLIAQLAPGQPLPTAALAERLGVDRMALSRLVAASGPQVVRMGRTRATAYALRRPTRAGSEWPLYRLREDATLEELGRVIALVGGGFHVDAGPDCPNLRRAPEGGVAAFFPDLPWYWMTCDRRDFLVAASPMAVGRRSACRRTSMAGNRTMC